ncbi:MAG: hypothetical protein GXP49_13060 [Deltaproteobacteria bacterium]|nr:hypothetical protein [Deltaproteobacteria bacterium]
MEDLRKRPVHIITDKRGMDSAYKALQDQDRLAVDTEANSFFAYMEKICVVQVSTPAKDWIFDMIALDTLEPIDELLTSKKILKILHGADYDIVSLKRDFDIGISPVFDTVIACRLLGIENFGLSDLAMKFAGVELSKEMQRIDWSKRPFTTGQVEYLRNDSRLLFKISEELETMLGNAGLLEEADIEFRRLEAREWSKKEFDPDGWACIRGAIELAHDKKSILRELHILRNDLARQFDFPPRKLLPDRLLLKLAEKKPTSGRALAAVKGIPGFLRKKSSKEFIGAIRRGLLNDDLEKVRHVKQRASWGNVRLENDARARASRLKDWRKQACSKTGRTTIAILPNPVLVELAKNPPSTMNELSGFPGLGKSRFKTFGKEILEVLLERPRKKK